MDFHQTLRKLFRDMPTSGVILMLLVLLLAVMYCVHRGTTTTPLQEGYTVNDRFAFKRGTANIYDDFYSDVYDYLVYNNVKDEYEIGAILNRTNPTTQSKILDIGCGTGHHVGMLAAKSLDVVGVDISPAMILKAKARYPQYRFIVGDALNAGLFPYGSFTHILCLYFTIYYFPDKQQFFRNAMDWLMPGGYLILHLVDRDHFDPILPTANPLFIVSPQKYAKERITRSRVTFDKFKYEANFVADGDDPGRATFEEKFVFPDGKARQQEHEWFMEPHQDILVMAQQVGFAVTGEVNMVKCAYENQYLYILTKQAN